MKKWIVLGIVVAGGVYGYPRLREWRAASEPSSAAASKTATAVVETRDIKFAVSAAGEIGPAEQVSVRPGIGRAHV